MSGPGSAPTLPVLADYYVEKWGGPPSQETYRVPFGGAAA